MSNIWFTGDTHIGHNNIVKGTSKWSNTSGCRDFKDVSEHDTTIINTFNKYVAPDDVLYHVGDWSFGGIQNILGFRQRLNCKTVHLCLGNHDHHIEKDKILPDLEERARSIFDSVDYVDLIKIEGHYIFLSHYAHRVWNGSHKGVIHLYGHSHGTIPDYGKSMDVGVDIAYRMFREYRPFKFQEIQKIMAKKEIYFPDHHDKKTNWR